MKLRTVVWPANAIGYALVLLVMFTIVVPVALWMAIQDLRTWKRRIA